MKGLALSLLLAASLAARTSAASDDDPHAAIAEKLAADANLPGAIAELEASYREHPRAARLVRVAELRRALRDDRGEAAALSTLLAAHGATMTPDERARAEQRLAALNGARPVASPPSAAPASATPPPGFAPASAPAPAPTKPKRKSTGMMITGIALTSVGVLAGVAGVWIIAAANAGQLGPCGTSTCAPTQQRWSGAFVAIAGGLAVAVGVPLLVIGGRAPAPPDPPVALGLSLREAF